MDCVGEVQGLCRDRGCSCSCLATHEAWACPDDLGQRANLPCGTAARGAGAPARSRATPAPSAARPWLRPAACARDPTRHATASARYSAHPCQHLYGCGPPLCGPRTRDCYGRARTVPAVYLARSSVRRSASTSASRASCCANEIRDSSSDSSPAPPEATAISAAASRDRAASFACAAASACSSRSSASEATASSASRPASSSAAACRSALPAACRRARPQRREYLYLTRMPLCQSECS